MNFAASPAHGQSPMSGSNHGVKRKSKASPSDVMFGQPPGSDGAVQSLGSLSSDSSPPSRTASRPSSRGGHNGPKASGSSRSPGSHLSPKVSTSSIGKTNPTTTAMATPSSMASDVGSSTSNLNPSTGTSAPTTTQSKSTPGDVVDGVKILPDDLEDADAEDIIPLVADMLGRLMVHNDSLPLHPSALTRFHSRATPAITIQSYLRRIARYTSLDKACTLILLVYIDRVCERMKGFTICSLTVHRFVCAAVVCASKALCDAFSTNGHYARVGGLSLVELNMLEKEFLSIIDWHLTCSGALLQHYYISLVGSHPSYALAENTAAASSSSNGCRSRSSSVRSDDEDAPMRSDSLVRENIRDEEASAGALAEAPFSAGGSKRHPHHHHHYRQHDEQQQQQHRNGPHETAERVAQQRAEASQPAGSGGGFSSSVNSSTHAEGFQ